MRQASRGLELVVLISAEGKEFVIHVIRPSNHRRLAVSDGAINWASERSRRGAGDDDSARRLRMIPLVSNHPVDRESGWYYYRFVVNGVLDEECTVAVSL